MASEIKLNAICYDSFLVLDNGSNPVGDLTDVDFTRKLFGPTGNDVSATILVTINELGSGLYRIGFTPNLIGQWLLVVYHSVYFPWGKGQNYICREYEIDDIGIETNQIQNLVNGNKDILSELNNQTITLLSFLKNKKLLRKEGSTWYIVIRDDTDSIDILKKALKDKDGNDVSDFLIGIMAQELATSV